MPFEKNVNNILKFKIRKLNCKPAPFSDSLERRYFSKTKSVPKTNVLEGLSKPVTAQTLPQTARQAVSNTNVLKSGMYRINNRTTQTRAPQSSQTFRDANPSMSTSTGVNHKTNVSRPQHRSNQLKDKVVPNNSQVKLKKTQVEDHHRIHSISNKIKSVTACNDSLNSKTLNVNAVCATCKKCLVDSDHFFCVTKMLNDVNARTKKPNIVPISTRQPKGYANKTIATPHKIKVASKSTTQKPKIYYRMLYEKTSNITINMVYYAEGLNYNLFSVGQFCDANLESLHLLSITMHIWHLPQLLRLLMLQWFQQSSEYSPPEAGLIIPVFQKGDDLIDAINHMMSFLTSVVAS
nr:hypothetical protein [Tanacetum cinerariifolium]